MAKKSYLEQVAEIRKACDVVALAKTSIARADAVKYLMIVASEMKNTDYIVEFPHNMVWYGECNNRTFRILRLSNKGAIVQKYIGPAETVGLTHLHLTPHQVTEWWSSDIPEGECAEVYMNALLDKSK